MIPQNIKHYLSLCKSRPFNERAGVFNEMTELLKDMLESPHPVLAVKLVRLADIQGNDYNPNRVAPPEMKLLELSIEKDGVTMPIVAAKNERGKYVIVDGFHRTQTIRYSPSIAESLHGFVPVVELNKDIADRIAATVRHNMARGSHKTGLSARLVGLLKKHNWTDVKIGKELGMDAEEVVRLKQLTGLAEAFLDQEFSKSWE